MNRQPQQLLQQQLLQPDWQKGCSAATTVTQSHSNPLLPSGNMPASNYGQLAASTSGVGTMPDPSVLSSFLGSVRGRLHLDGYSANLQQFASLPSQFQRLQYLPQSQSSSQECGLTLHSAATQWQLFTSAVTPWESYGSAATQWKPHLSADTHRKTCASPAS
ncbi:unnamed protein product [Candidula unifasciata]|uniref:Uncharacterized protein n=1 Tax=Candidula unifasciata TaxID=100452 RepID=A0A8S3Z0R6_9EUPU|nr:unnamed protein product [Candidula unifasciata]